MDGDRRVYRFSASFARAKDRSGSGGGGGEEEAEEEEEEEEEALAKDSSKPGEYGGDEVGGDGGTAAPGGGKARDGSRRRWARWGTKRTGTAAGGGRLRGRSRDECVTRRFYCAFVTVMIVVALVVVITCVCSAKRDVDPKMAPSKCQTGMFECETTKTCINATLRCNKLYDCDDGSDEGSICDKLHDEYYETILKKRPDAEFDRVDPHCSVKKVPEGCRCNNNTNLYCENNFHQVPSPLPDGITFLDLSGNEIPVVRTNDLGHLPQLRKLIMVHSSVRHIEDRALSQLSALHEMHLTTNELTRVPGKAFRQDSVLNILILKENRIDKLLLEDLQSFLQLEILDLHKNNISYIAEDAFSMMPNLKRLDLSENRLDNIRASFFKYLPNLQGLYLNKNGISYIESGSFAVLESLWTLDLYDNNLRHIPAGVFSGLRNLSHLQLENNGIRTIDPEAFSSLVNVISLPLTGNDLQHLTNRTFSHMTKLHYIYFDKFYLCVYAQHAKECEPQGDGISSRYNLLENVVLRVCVWVVAVLACLGNVLVFLGRFLLREDNQIHSFFIKNLSLADMLMGVYLVVIGTQDIRYRGEYLLYDEAWRNSRECDISGVLSTLSTEMSVLTLCVITLDRYISIMYPLSFRKRGLKAAYGAMGCTWLVCILITLLPIMGFRYFGSSFYRDNGVCVPLHIHDPRVQGWEYSCFLFLGINLASFGFIAYAYTAMFWSIHKSAIPLRTSRESKERCLVKRFFFIVITDFLCWIPIIIIKVIALSGVSVSQDLYAWVVIFILPVNSALNPLLYTLTTKLFKQKLLSKFTSVVWRPTTAKEGSLSSRASMRGNSSLNRNALGDVELEMLRRHRCFKNGVKRSSKEGRDSQTTTTPLASSPAHTFWNGGTSPPRQDDPDRNCRIFRNEYSQI